MWKPEIEELEKRKKIARMMGGEKNVEKQHKKGMMTVRERIDKLADKGSFIERGMLAGASTYDSEQNDKLLELIPCPFVMGIAKIDGRRTAVHGDDYTIKGASVGRLYKNKGKYFSRMARAFKLPVVRLIESGGGTISEIAEIGYTEPPDATDEQAQNLVEMMSEVPVVSVGFGAVAGIGAVYMVQSHFSVMVREKTQVFVGGPHLVKWAFQEEISREDLGGYRIHTRKSGVVDNEAESEEDALNQAKRFLSYLPSNAWEMPERKNYSNDPPDRREEELVSIIPRDRKKDYDIRRLLRLVLDRDSIFEIGEHYAKAQVTALARLNGYPVGVLANDCRHGAGAFDHTVGGKFQRFVDMCDTFHIPIVNFVDQPGFAIGRENEEQGNPRKGVRASFSIVQASVPNAVVYLRRCFGAAGTMQKSAMRLSWRYAWPSAVWGNIPVEGGVYAAHKNEIRSAENPEARLNELQKKYQAIASPFRTAEAFRIEDIIDPRDTRMLLCEWVEMAYDAEKTNLGVKHRGMRC